MAILAARCGVTIRADLMVAQPTIIYGAEMDLLWSLDFTAETQNTLAASTDLLGPYVGGASFDDPFPGFIAAAQEYATPLLGEVGALAGSLEHPSVEEYDVMGEIARLRTRLDDHLDDVDAYDPGDLVLLFENRLF